MTPAIRVENLSKRYRLGSGSRGDRDYRTLREALVESAAGALRPVGRALRPGRPTRRDEAGAAPRHEPFWALRDVSFEVQPGEVVGIIGRNGAGKSTLLKILSQITEPTSGRALIHGRVGSLLEVGTGFHPELTGRENIFLNGSILGMSRREIAGKFDEIVEFAEVERFLDTPVKRYSSGMYVRLAFAVATHLNPEILIVDEVLAVGDATYQRRCIDRMSQLAASGRTVLFVSHNMDLIPRLCRRVVTLERGRVAGVGPAREAVERYLEGLIDAGRGQDLSRRARGGDGRARFVRVDLVDGAGTGRAGHPSGEDLVVEVAVEAARAIGDAALAVNVRTLHGARVFSGWTREAGFRVDLAPGEQVFRCRFEGVRARPGQRLSLELWMEAGPVMDHVEDALVFDVIDGRDTDGFSTDTHQGIVLCDYEWTRSAASRRD